MHPHPPTLTIGGTTLEESDDLVILRVTFDFKMTLGSSLGFQSSSQRLGILRKSWQIFHDRLLLGRCCRGFALLVLEYCSAVWCSLHIFNYWTVQSVVPGFELGVCFSVTLHIVDLWRYYV